MMNTGTDNEDVAVIVVARHGERLDYYIRDNPDAAASVSNWVAVADRPFDPPLTSHGEEQATTLGRHLSAELSKLGYPAISEIYSSPLLRCRQTSYGIRHGHTTNESPIPVRVEPCLVESINEAWYRSWALPGSDGTWGYRINGKTAYDVCSIHPLSKIPVQALLEEWKADERIDRSYTPKTSITEPYSFDPSNFESNDIQRRRMNHVISSVCQYGKTIMLVSHGGPVTHLYEELTGNSWHIHGESKYCCYSIYVKNKKSHINNAWKPIQVNNSNYLHEKLHGDKYISDDDP